MSQSEQLILKLLQNKNEEVFENLYEGYCEELILFAMHYLGERQKAEDIVQEFFLYFWNHTGSLTITTSIKSYLYTSIKNRCLNHLRDLKVRDKYNLIYLESLWTNIQNDTIEDSSLIREVLTAIENLPTELSDIFTLKYVEMKKISEIAKSRNINENTIKKRLMKARAILQKKLSHLKSILFLFICTWLF
ncbi:MAG: RNA polymerase sigma-70 factor [Bacteroidales bacterium]|nr:RNA polymerase sigma-70 factor [Bacteroidales bacterium]